jgi:hypothetical protein
MKKRSVGKEFSPNLKERKEKENAILASVDNFPLTSPPNFKTKKGRAGITQW